MWLLGWDLGKPALEFNSRAMADLTEVLLPLSFSVLAHHVGFVAPRGEAADTRPTWVKLANE